MTDLIPPQQQFSVPPPLAQPAPPTPNGSGKRNGLVVAGAVVLVALAGYAGFATLRWMSAADDAETARAEADDQRELAAFVQGELDTRETRVQDLEQQVAGLEDEIVARDVEIGDLEVEVVGLQDEIELLATELPALDDLDTDLDTDTDTDLDTDTEVETDDSSGEDAARAMFGTPAANDGVIDASELPFVNLVLDRVDPTGALQIFETDLPVLQPLVAQACASMAVGDTSTLADLGRQASDALPVTVEDGTVLVILGALGACGNAVIDLGLTP